MEKWHLNPHPQKMREWPGQEESTKRKKWKCKHLHAQVTWSVEEEQRRHGSWSGGNGRGAGEEAQVMVGLTGSCAPL